MLRILARYGCLFLLAAILLPASSLIRNPDGTLEIFTLGANGYVYHNYQASPGGTWVTTGTWPSLGGGGLTSPPEAIVNSGGIVALFAMGSDGNVHSNYKLPSTGWATTGTWGPLSSNGNFIGTPAAVYDGSGLVEVFAQGADGNIYYDYQTSSTGAWYTGGAWPSIGGGGLVSPPSIVVSSNGIISLFATGSDGNVRSNYRIPGSNWATTGAWGTLSSSGNFAGAPVAISNTDGTVEVFALGADGNVYHDYQTSSTTGAWYTGTAWPSLGGGGLASPPAVVVSSNGIVSLFAMGSDGNIHVNYKLPGSGWATTGTWGPLSSNGIFAGTPLAITDGNGYVEVFAWGVDGNFYHDAQISPSAWYTVGTWPTLGGDGILLGSAPPPKLLPGTPAKEYVYFNGQVIAVENAGP